MIPCTASMATLNRATFRGVLEERVSGVSVAN